jgi:hypothetical protein
LCRRHFFAKPDLRQLFSSQGPMLWFLKYLSKTKWRKIWRS